MTAERRQRRVVAAATEAGLPSRRNAAQHNTSHSSSSPHCDCEDVCCPVKGGSSALCDLSVIQSR